MLNCVRISLDALRSLANITRADYLLVCSEGYVIVVEDVRRVKKRDLDQVKNTIRQLMHNREVINEVERLSKTSLENIKAVVGFIHFSRAIGTQEYKLILKLQQEIKNTYRNASVNIANCNDQLRIKINRIIK